MSIGTPFHLPWIKEALRFAARKLVIRDARRLCDYSLFYHDDALSYRAQYCIGSRRILFNGEPDSYVVMHEAIHFHQHERGEDLERDYQEMLSSTRTAYCQKGFTDARIHRLAYWDCPHEIEARKVGSLLARQWESGRAYRVSANMDWNGIRA